MRRVVKIHRGDIPIPASIPIYTLAHYEIDLTERLKEIDPDSFEGYIIRALLGHRIILLTIKRGER